jgi:hypothetical protein
VSGKNNCGPIYAVSNARLDIVFLLYGSLRFKRIGFVGFYGLSGCAYKKE